MKYIPIKFHITYVMCTLLISFYGPVIYHNYNKELVFLFIFVYLFSVSVGFYLGVNNSIASYRLIKDSNKSTLMRLLRFCLKLGVFLFVINAIYLFITNRLNIRLSSIGANYIDYYKIYNNKTTNHLFTFENLFVSISAIPKFVSLVLGFYYYSLLSKKYKNLFLLLLCLIVVTQSITIGNQKSLGDIIIIGVVVFLVKSLDLGKKIQKKRLKKSLIAFGLMFLIFSYFQYSRLASRGITTFDINSHVAFFSQYNLDHIIFKIFGLELGLGISHFLTSYLSGGYYGLSLCLQLPFEWTYGIGSSVGLSNIFEKLLSIDIYSNTYLFRMEQTYGLLGKQRWHTIFPWIASDFTFAGSVLFLFFTSFYYGKCWKEILIYKNPVSLLLFCLLSTLFLFVPANNQIFHGFDYIMISSFTIGLWRISHRNYNFYKKHG